MDAIEALRVLKSSIRQNTVDIDITDQIHGDFMGVVTMLEEAYYTIDRLGTLWRTNQKNIDNKRKLRKADYLLFLESLEAVKTALEAVSSSGASHIEVLSNRPTIQTSSTDQDPI